jgi:hypothetical protein
MKQQTAEMRDLDKVILMKLSRFINYTKISDGDISNYRLKSGTEW